jgi:Flp pilus assembly protein TadB
MTSALLLGAGIGAGLWILARGLWPPRPSLAEALAALHRTPRVATHPHAFPDRSIGTLVHLGRPLAAALAGRHGRSLTSASVERDLAVLGRSPDAHIAEKLVTGLVGLLLIPVAAALMRVGGIDFPLIVAPWLVMLLAGAGFVVPDLAVRSQAAERRREMRHALGAFVDLTVVSLAGGSGVEAALRSAAAVGDGEAFRMFRRALDAARLIRETPWSALERLGQEVGVPELEEMAASVGLAGTEGARVRQSLAARAASLRAHGLAEAEGNGHAATQRMTLTLVLLLVGFLVFVLFPAYSRVFGAL